MLSPTIHLTEAFPQGIWFCYVWFVFSPTRLHRQALRTRPVRVGENHTMQRNVAAVRVGQRRKQSLHLQPNVLFAGLTVEPRAGKPLG